MKVGVGGWEISRRSWLDLYVTMEFSRPFSPLEKCSAPWKSALSLGLLEILFPWKIMSWFQNQLPPSQSHCVELSILCTGPRVRYATYAFGSATSYQLGYTCGRDCVIVPREIDEVCVFNLFLVWFYIVWVATRSIGSKSICWPSLFCRSRHWWLFVHMGYVSLVYSGSIDISAAPETARRIVMR